MSKTMTDYSVLDQATNKRTSLLNLAKPLELKDLGTKPTIEITADRAIVGRIDIFLYQNGKVVAQRGDTIAPFQLTDTDKFLMFTPGDWKIKTSAYGPDRKTLLENGEINFSVVNTATSVPPPVASKPDDTTAPPPPPPPPPVAPPVVTTPVVVEPPIVTPDVPAPYAIADCIAFCIDGGSYALAPKIEAAAGVSAGYRWFGGGSVHGKVKYVGHDGDLAVKLRAVSPKSSRVIHFGISEQEVDKTGKVTRLATIWTPAEKHVFWKGVNTELAKDPEAYAEGENESDTNHYEDNVQTDGIYSQDVVDYDAETNRIMRQELGGDRRIVTSTVGYHGVALQLAYVKGKRDAGMYADKNAVCGLHAYMYSSEELEALLSGVRELIGWDIPIFITEWGVKYKPKNDGTYNLTIWAVEDMPAVIIAELQVIAKYRAKAFYFRGHVADATKWYAKKCPLNADNSVNQVIAQAFKDAVKPLAA